MSDILEANSPPRMNVFIFIRHISWQQQIYS